MPLAGGSWVRKADYPNPVTHLSAVAFNGKIYAFGGEKAWDEQGGNQTKAYEYDPATNKWTSIAPLPKPRSHFAASTFVAGDKIMAVGGTTNGGDGGLPMNGVDEYDPAANTWRSLTSLPTALKVPAAGYIRGDIYLSTGSTREFAHPVRESWVGVLS